MPEILTFKPRLKPFLLPRYQDISSTWIGEAKNTGLDSSFPGSHSEGDLPRRDRVTCSWLPVILRLCLGRVWLRGREYFLPLNPHFLDGYSASAMNLLRIPGPSICVPSHGVGISKPRERGNLKNLEVLAPQSSSTQLLKGDVTQEREYVSIPNITSRIMPQRFTQGEKRV